jgi:UrcA family protein
MKALTNMRRSTRGRLVQAAATLALTVGASAAALAGPPANRPSEMRSAAISLAGLDLSTPEGLGAARDRVRKAAHKLCRHVADSFDLSRDANFAACVDETFTSAMARLTEHPTGVVARSVAGPGYPR